MKKFSTIIITAILILLFSGIAYSAKTITVEETDLVSLELEAQDADGDELTYEFSAPLDENGKWHTDYGDEGEYEVIITVYNINQAPVADAGEDQTVTEGVMVDLDGSGSYDPDMDDITYQWIAPAGIYLMDATTATPSFIAPQIPTNTPVELTFELVVNDGNKHIGHE